VKEDKIAILKMGGGRYPATFQQLSVLLNMKISRLLDEVGPTFGLLITNI